MARVKTEVCEVCRSEHCKGDVYRTKEPVTKILGMIPKEYVTVCSSNNEIFLNEGKMYYRVVYAHGISNDYELERVKEGEHNGR